MPIPDDADKEKLAEVALAILWLGAHGDKHVTRVWKGIDWDVTDMLFEKGEIRYVDRGRGEIGGKILRKTLGKE